MKILVLLILAGGLAAPLCGSPVTVRFVEEPAEEKAIRRSLRELPRAAERWRCNCRPRAVAVADGVLYVLGHRRLFALDAADGSPVWDLGEQEASSPYPSSLVVLDERVAAGSTAEPGSKLAPRSGAAPVCTEPPDYNRQTPMIELTFDDLLLDLTQRRQLGEPPPVLLLGAGASVEAGIEAMDGLFEMVRCKDFPEFVRYIEKRKEDERYRLLANYLQTQAPEEVTPGYQALAGLCAAAFLDFVLTTNLDPLLDDALAAANLWRRDYLLLVNGILNAERVERLLRARSPRVKVIKLHGDLFHRLMAWTPAEMAAYLEELGPHLAPVLAGRDVLVVGHSLRDERIRELVLGTGGVIWYPHPEEVPDHLQGHDRVRAVLGDDCRFERLLPALARGLGVATPKAPEPPAAVPVRSPWRGALPLGVPAVDRGAPPRASAAQTVDDLLAAVAAVAAPGGVPALTAFLLAEPRRVVTEGWAASQLARDGKLDLVTPGGARFSARVLRRVEGHPFGPLVIEAPAGWNASGLDLVSELPAAGEAIHIAVAAGGSTGLSSGSVPTGVEELRLILPAGRMPHIVELACPTAPGASGAPVVDSGLAVRGLIIAGSRTLDEPRSFMYPAFRWAGGL